MRMPSASEVPVLEEYERLLFYVVAYAQLFVAYERFGEALTVRFPSGIEPSNPFANELIRDLLMSGWVAESADGDVILRGHPVMVRLPRRRAAITFITAGLAMSRARGELGRVQIVVPPVLPSSAALIGSMLRQAKEVGWVDGWYHEASRTLVLIGERSS